MLLKRHLRLLEVTTYSDSLRPSMFWWNNTGNAGKGQMEKSWALFLRSLRYSGLRVLIGYRIGWILRAQVRAIMAMVDIPGCRIRLHRKGASCRAAYDVRGPGQWSMTSLEVVT
jgi:hypothetical protein